MVEIHTSNSKFLLFRSKHFLGSKNFSKILIFRYPYELSKFFEKSLSKMTIFSSNMMWKKKILLFVSFWTLNYIFVLYVSNLFENCDLLRYIMFILVKNWANGRGVNIAKISILDPLPITHFLHNINITYLKRSHF